MAKRSKATLATIDARLARIESLLGRELKSEQSIASEQRSEEDELRRLESLEREIKQDVAQHPLTKITYHDVTKGLIGAFFGVVGHFSFFYGHKLAEGMSVLRATFILTSSMLILVAFLYFTGFRRIKEYHTYLPTRFLVIYFTAISVATAVLFLFGVIHIPFELEMLYKEVAAVSVLAVMGAATADLIGGEA